MKKLLPLALLILPLFCKAQSNDTLAPTVIDAAGGYGKVGSVSLSYSAGEPVTTTAKSPFNPPVYLTQGFQQPDLMNALNLKLTSANESCLNSKDGAAFISITGGAAPYTITWSFDTTGSFTNSLSVDSLVPGSYTVMVKDHNGNTITAPFVIQASETACSIKIYNGITPNGDGHNDTWIIDNIEAYPDNSVSIFNRWGIKVWNANGYDNNKVVWYGQNAQGQPLPDGTYFYIVKISGATPFKGWVQVTR